MDRTEACLCLLCHYLKLLQACTQWVVATWSATTVRDVLKFTNAFQKAMNKLDITELTALHEFLPTLQSKFQHLSLNVVSSHGLHNALHILLHILTANPYLPSELRDCIFEHCLDLGVEVPKFQPVPEGLADLPTRLLHLIEGRIFSSHIRQLDSFGPDRVSMFLDSCFTVDSHRFIDLIVITLEQLSSTEGNQIVTNHLLSWLHSAVRTDNVVRICLAQQNPRRLCDLVILYPDFERCILRLFDVSQPLQPIDGVPKSSTIMSLVEVLASSLPGGYLLPAMIKKLADSELADSNLWRTVAIRLHSTEYTSASNS
ncbi:hypothetical protein PHET_02899 [Paragonimus heterotremus]|uniref:Uncharacterized protein n=1 Tax=Paragonimus heterotremus TaxID=100268 RepID=A0A8J4SRH0_9TREM|nr:hypothetical protein PHET_02899 [Paragonimus heterotremus]